jgi:tryptophan halogenase
LIPAGYHPIVDVMSADELRKFMNNIAAKYVKTVAGYPSHQEFIDQYCKAASPD